MEKHTLEEHLIWEAIEIDVRFEWVEDKDRWELIVIEIPFKVGDFYTCDEVDYLVYGCYEG